MSAFEHSPVAAGGAITVALGKESARRVERFLGQPRGVTEVGRLYLEGVRG